MPATTFLRRLIKDASRIDRASIEPLYALRCTVGVAIPLVVALVAQHPLSGVSAALGAQVVGFASRQGVYRTRAAVMLFTAAATGAGSLVGSLTGGDALLNVGVTAVWGMCFGVLASLGNSANAVGLNSLVALIVFSQIGFTPAQAGQQAVLVFAGGVLQTILLVSVWPLQRFSAERNVLERAYRSLADYVVHIPVTKLQSPNAQTLVAAIDTLADPQPFAKRGETAAFEALLVEAERLRGTLAALATDLHAFASEELPRAEAALVALCAHARDLFVEIADALHEARAPRDIAPAWTALDEDVEALERELATTAAGTNERGLLNQTVGDGRALAGQLRAAWRAASAPVQPNAGPPSESPAARLFRPSVFYDAGTTLRANCSWYSPFGRHALRVGATLAIACTLEHMLPLARAYWIPLTAAIVLRPDFGATFTRGIARLAGTLLGALAASLIALLLRPGPELYLMLALCAATVAYLTVAANFALFSAGITTYVIFLLAFGGLPEHTAVAERLWASFVGGILALLAYIIWPAWERERVSVELAKLLDRARAFGIAVLTAYYDRATRDERAMYAAQLAVRLARSNAETSVDRMLAEPVHARVVTVRAALGILAASRRFGLAALTLQARLPRAAAFTHPSLRILCEALDSSLRLLATALREQIDPGTLPPLRDLQIALRRAVQKDANSDAGVLVSETDLMVDSVKIIADLVRQSHAARRLRAQARRRRRRSHVRNSANAG